MKTKMVSYTLELEKPARLTKARRAKLKTLATRPDSEVDTSDIPEMTEEQWKHARRGHFYRPRKRQITARVDADVLDWLRFNTCITEVRPTSVIVSASGAGEAGRAGGAVGARRDGTEEIPADAVYLLTGYRADSELMVKAGILLNDREAPTVSPETFETNVPGLFVAGGAIAGVDTGTIFIENGRFHGEKIIETIAARSGTLG